MDPNNYDMASQLGGPSKSIAVFKGNIRPLHDRVIVREMNFGEMKTKAGLIIMSDDGKNHGIKPRWGKIYAIGHENKEEYKVGDWLLIEHGRWTRGYNVELPDEDEVVILRTVDTDGILAWQHEEPDSGWIGDIT
jgi:co-chaperonin GroES (HSP10)